ncbi:adenylyl-sulfate kinase [Sphingomonas sp. ID0503]|uniref:adenylyl-sulfate kinase n=1 Tax=Sphingomonas sp. ID0503 TaxID=3399691 RepID=UPI003AFADD66
MTSVETLPGVIWVTGFSGAGKSTVAAEVWQLLDQSGAKGILLDGDELRDIYGKPYGYERGDRVALGYVNFTLCRYLAAQGCTVVIAAAGMYEEILDWNRAHIPNFIQVYLRVSDTERRERDARTKKVYGEINNLDKLYDEPATADLTIENAGKLSPVEAAEQILDFYRAKAAPAPRAVLPPFWEEHYAQDVPNVPSDLAQSLAESFGPAGRLIEIGCGRGADAAFFAERGWQVVAVDSSDTAISICRAAAAQSSVDFRIGTIADVADEFRGTADLVLCRNVLDALTVAEEAELLRDVRAVLRPGGKLAIECASILDLAHRQGKAIGPGERLQDRYRRFQSETAVRSAIRRAGLEVLSTSHVEVPRGANAPTQVLIRVIAGLPA